MKTITIEELKRMKNEGTLNRVSIYPKKRIVCISGYKYFRVGTLEINYLTINEDEKWKNGK